MIINGTVQHIQEQQKIGAFLKQLDNNITLNQRKADILKELKKGFLQQMFIWHSEWLANYVRDMELK